MIKNQINNTMPWKCSKEQLPPPQPGKQKMATFETEKTGVELCRGEGQPSAEVAGLSEAQHDGLTRS